MVRQLRDAVFVDRWYRRGMSEAEVGEAAARIGDHAWVEVESGVASAAPAPPAPEPVDVVEDESPDGELAGDEPVDAAPAESAKDGVEPPPQSGPGSSERKWRDYAGTLGVDVSEAKDRAGVIALVEAAGKPV